MFFRRRPKISASGGEALGRLLLAPTFELIPLKDSMARAAFLPHGARVSVTASPNKGMDATIALCEQLQRAGFRSVPHLSAHMVRDRAHLTDILARLRAAGIDGAFVVGGDASTRGEYADGLALLRGMSEVGHDLVDIGIPCYPQGHAFIGDGPLLEALREKAAYATYMTTQLCFDPAAIVSWLAARRSEGLSLPAHIGVPGVLEPHRLLAISARIGVADARRFLAKNVRLVARLVRSAGFYRPDALLGGLAPSFADPEQGISALHVYTFNAVEATEAWRRDYLAATARLAPSAADAHPTARGVDR